MKSKIILFLSAIVFMGLFTHGQGRSGKDEIIFSKKNFGITIVPAVYQKNRIFGDVYKYNISASPQFGGEAMVNYSYNFEKKFWLILSAGANAVAYDFDFYILKEYFGYNTADVSENGVFAREWLFNLRSQVELQAKFEILQNWKWILSAGASLLYAPASEGTINHMMMNQNGQYEPFSWFDQQEGNMGKPWPNFHISAGQEWMMSNGHLLQIALKVNYSTVDFMYGTYSFKVGNQPESRGEYGVSGSYIGLNLSYFFAKYKKV